MEMMAFPKALRAAAAASILFASFAQAAVVNGGFETGDLSGWSISGDTSFTGVASGIEHSGLYAAFFGPDPLATLSQMLPTVSGSVYRVEFWLALDDSATPNNFSWSWDGLTQSALVDAAAFNYTRFTALVTAAGSSTELAFAFTNPQSFWRLDDVSVSVVPEPSSAALALPGLLLIAAAARRRRRD